MSKAIDEGNKLVAEFMGWGYHANTEHPHVFPNGFWKDGGMTGHKELFFHSSWDWLMPCLQKITAMNVPSASEQMWLMTKVFSALGTLEIKKAWQASIDFIQWYNQNQKTNNRHLSI